MSKTTRIPVSATAAGFLLPVNATATPGNTVHEGTTRKVNGYDLVTLSAQNSHISAVVLSIELTDGTSTRTLSFSIPAQSSVNEFLKDFPVNEGFSILAFAATANVVTVFGHADQVQTSGLDMSKVG